MKESEAIEWINELKCSEEILEFYYAESFIKACDMAIQALEKQINGSWISVNDRLPEEAYGCLVTVMDCDPYLMKDYENIYPEPVGWDGKSWNNSDGHEISFEVLAWMPLPDPYKECD